MLGIMIGVIATIGLFLALSERNSGSSKGNPNATQGKNKADNIDVYLMDEFFLD